MEPEELKLLQSLAEKADETVEEFRAEIRAVNQRMCRLHDESFAELRACRRAAEFCEAFLVVAAVSLVIFLLVRSARARDTFADALEWISPLLGTGIKAILPILTWALFALGVWEILQWIWKSISARRSRTGHQAAEPAQDAQKS